MFSTRSAAVKPTAPRRRQEARYERRAHKAWPRPGWRSRRIPRPREPGEPQDRRFLMLERGMRFAADRGAMPMHVGRAPEPMGDHPRGRGLVGRPVDEDEGAGRAVVGIGVEGDRHGRCDVAEPDLVEVELLRRELVEIVDVEAVLELRDLGRHGARADLHQIGAAGQHGVGAHPDQMRGELVGDLRPARRVGEHVAAGDIDLVFERQRHRVARFGAFLLLVGDQDRLDFRLLPRTGDDDRLAARDPPARDRAGEAAEIEMRPVDPLHRQAERRAAAILLDLDGFEPLQQMAALIPRRPLTDRRHIVAEAGRDRNREEGSGSRAARRTCDRR